MQCPNCGAEAENGQWFCKDCGIRLTPAPEANDVASETEVIEETEGLASEETAVAEETAPAEALCCSIFFSK